MNNPFDDNFKFDKESVERMCGFLPLGDKIMKPMTTEERATAQALDEWREQARLEGKQFDSGD